MYDLFDIKPQILDCSHVILYGNDIFYLTAYARALVTGHHHFEAQDDNIKDILMNKSLTGEKHIFILKTKVYKLKSLLEIDNARFIIISPTLSKIDSYTKSRCCLLRCAFDKDKVRQFLENKYSVDYDDTKSIISNLMPDRNPKYISDLHTLITTKHRTQLDLINAIKIYARTNLHVPLPEICRLIIVHFASHKKIHDIVAICAEVDHQNSIGAQNILCYEAVFLKLFCLIKKN